MKNEAFLKEFGFRVRNLRLNYPPKGMSQEELAIKAGYTSRSSINKIELGLIDVPQSKIIMLADALGCTPAYLMGWTNSPNDNESNNSFTHPSEDIVFFDELGKICAGYDGGVDEIPTGRKIPILFSAPCSKNARFSVFCLLQFTPFYPILLPKSVTKLN